MYPVDFCIWNLKKILPHFWKLFHVKCFKNIFIRERIWIKICFILIFSRLRADVFSDKIYDNLCNGKGKGVKKREKIKERESE